ncbi:TetR/AcrR family transcriptional regulator [Dactylosporangium sp. NPDC005555]|uniref:TetR/AcrR family transcriptional regulator n=1 Tax=Dactylosporangium sp. NPDC005555 TaxID=3154889 RepID=UPI0033BB2565
MPRILAPTVAEHRAAQHRALLDAARAILAEDSGQAPSLAAVASRAGLARTSVYEYFRSRQDLLDALVADVFPRWSARVSDAMAAAGAPGEQVLAYVDANLRLVADGEHAVARALAAVAPGQHLDTSTRTMHEQLSTPLVEALTALNLPDPATTAELINSVVYAASRLIESGDDPRTIRRRADELLAPFLLGGPSP